jgi:hypothetical protein
LGTYQIDEVELRDQVAIEQLAALSLFARWLDDADVVTFRSSLRQRRSVPRPTTSSFDPGGANLDNP